MPRAAGVAHRCVQLDLWLDFDHAMTLATSVVAHFAPFANGYWVTHAEALEWEIFFRCAVAARPPRGETLSGHNPALVHKTFCGRLSYDSADACTRL